MADMYISQLKKEYSKNYDFLTENISMHALGFFPFQFFGISSLSRGYDTSRSEQTLQTFLT